MLPVICTKSTCTKETSAEGKVEYEKGVLPVICTKTIYTTEAGEEGKVEYKKGVPTVICTKAVCITEAAAGTEKKKKSKQEETNEKRNSLIKEQILAEQQRNQEINDFISAKVEEDQESMSKVEWEGTSNKELNAVQWNSIFTEEPWKRRMHENEDTTEEETNEGYAMVRWRIDNGADRTITPVKRIIHEAQPTAKKFTCAGKSTIKAALKGTLICKDGIEWVGYYVPEACRGLVGSHEFKQITGIADRTTEGYLLKKQGEKIATQDGIWTTEMKINTEEVNKMQVEKCTISRMLHVINGHRFPKIPGCVICAQAGMKSMSYAKVRRKPRKVTHFGQLVYIDILEATTSKYRRRNYAIVMVDAWSRFTDVIPVSTKKDAEIKAISIWKSRYGKLENIKPDNAGEFRADNRHFREALSHHGVKRIPRKPYAHQKSGIAESNIQALQRTSRAMLLEADLPENFWNFSVTHASAIHNRTPHTGIQNQIPNSRSGMEDENVCEDMRKAIFGQSVIGIKPHELRKRKSKIANQAEIGKFLGNDRDTQTAILLVEGRIQKFNTIKVMNEHYVPKKTVIEEERDPLAVKQAENTVQEYEAETAEEDESKEDFEDERCDIMARCHDQQIDELQSEEITDQESGAESCKSTTQTSSMDAENVSQNGGTDNEGPTETLYIAKQESSSEEECVCAMEEFSEEYVDKEDWVAALKREIAAHYRAENPAVIDVQSDEERYERKVLGNETLKSKMRAKVKNDYLRTKKCRLTLGGMKEKYAKAEVHGGIATMIDWTTIQIQLAFLAICMRRQIAKKESVTFRLDLRDAIGAYLSARYRTPDNVQNEDYDTALGPIFRWPLQVRKAIPGLSKYSRCRNSVNGLRYGGFSWNYKRDMDFASTGWKRNTIDSNMFSHPRHKTTTVTAHVDDFTFTGEASDNKKAIEEIGQKIPMSTPEVIKKGEVEKQMLLGVQVAVNYGTGEIELDMLNYIDGMVAQAGLTEHKIRHIPYTNTDVMEAHRINETNRKCTLLIGQREQEQQQREQEQQYDKERYREKQELLLKKQQLQGGVAWCLRTHHEIRSAARHAAQLPPTEATIKIFERIIAYLSSGAVFRMRAESDDLACITAQSDAAFATEVGRESVSGYAVKISGITVLARSRKQKTIATSPAEAELMSAFACNQSIRHIQNLILSHEPFQTNALIHEHIPKAIQEYEKESERKVYIETSQQTDNKPALSQLLAPGACAKLKHLDVKLSALKQSMRRKHFTLEHRPRNMIYVDVLTHPTTKNEFTWMAQKLGIFKRTPAEKATEEGEEREEMKRMEV